MCQHIGGGAKVGMAPGRAVPAAGAGLPVSLFSFSAGCASAGVRAGGMGAVLLPTRMCPPLVGALGHRGEPGKWGSGKEQVSLQNPLSSPP